MKTIYPKSCVKGSINIPGDKSISHRAVMLGSLAKGTTVISNFLLGEDCLSTINCFKNMGVKITINKNQVFVKGNGLYGLKPPKKTLYVGNSGTTARLMAGILAGQSFSCEITGDDSIKKRPMQRVIDPLFKMGASIKSKGGTCPLKIIGSRLNNIEYVLPVASAQVKSALLFASLYARGKTILSDPFSTRNHTEIMLSEFGANLQINEDKIISSPAKELYAKEVFVPGDISSAAFFIVIALILKNSHIIIKNVGVNPTRTGVLDALKKMGANIKILNKKTICGEPVADIEVKSSELKAITLEGSIIPKMIDEVPVFAVAALFAKGTTVIKDASELKIKESNRISAISTELNKMGANITPTPDGMIIAPTSNFKKATLDSHKDHRIAMSLTVAGICANQEINLLGPDCINISFPDFFKILKNL